MTSTDTAVDIQGYTEAEAIVELINQGYDDVLDAPAKWEQGYSVVDDIQVDEGRWQMFMQSIVLAPSGKFYAVDWERGLTEMQEQRPFEYSDPEPYEVQRVEKKVTIVEWVTKT